MITVRKLRSALMMFAILICQIMLTGASGVTIPEFIEQHKDNEQIVLNGRTCARNARLFYVTFISGSSTDDYMKTQTSHLEKAAKKIQAQGGELIICVYNLKLFREVYDDVVKQAKKCNIKCPIINTTEADTKEAIYGSRSIIAFGGIYVVNSYGQRLCELYRNNDTIYIREDGGERRPYDIKINPRKSWEAELLTRSCKDMLQKYAPTVNKKPAPQEKQKKKEKKAKKEQEEPTPKRWKKLDI